MSHGANPRNGSPGLFTSSPGAAKNTDPSRHAQFYSDLVPGMIPVALLGSAVYLVSQGMRLLQASLSHEKYLEQAEARVKELEVEIETLMHAQAHGQDASSEAHSDPSNGICPLA
ncbi:hypothetical protein IEO21_00687 [Rhodonia placenta]|uniref:Uncharacterized protein n=1 Tax=Rhodonia placenta TaxID=104341 RepID=A0A8H7PB30_9APHY|nr:hypothetical protein IEO21_00687 [Postia placenta]